MSYLGYSNRCDIKVNDTLRNIGCFIDRTPEKNALIQWNELIQSWEYGIDGQLFPLGKTAVKINADIIANPFTIYFVDTSILPVSIRLPSNPKPSDEIEIYDLNGTFDVNSLILLGNGSPILTHLFTVSITEKFVYIKLIYLNNIDGWIIISSASNMPSSIVTSVNGRVGNIEIIANDILSFVPVYSVANKTGNILLYKDDIIGLSNLLENSLLGISNGIATLDLNGKVPLEQISDSLLGQVKFKGIWDASINEPALPEIPNSNGEYYIVSSNGEQFGISFLVGDWCISNGSSWSKINNTDAVTSVNGRIGNVIVTKSDLNLEYVDNTSDENKPISIATLEALDTKVDKIIGKNLSTEDFTTIEKNKLANLSKSDVGLNLVDNTSDLNKPVSIPTETALNTKIDKTEIGIANGIVPLNINSKIDGQYLDISLLNSDSYGSVLSIVDDYPTELLQNGQFYIVSNNSPLVPLRNKIIEYKNGIWNVITPKTGWMRYVTNLKELYIYDVAWNSYISSISLPINISFFLPGRLVELDSYVGMYIVSNSNGILLSNHYLSYAKCTNPPLIESVYYYIYKNTTLIGYISFAPNSYNGDVVYFNSPVIINSGDAIYIKTQLLNNLDIKNVSVNLTACQSTVACNSTSDNLNYEPLIMTIETTTENEIFNYPLRT